MGGGRLAVAPARRRHPGGGRFPLGLRLPSAFGGFCSMGRRAPGVCVPAQHAAARASAAAAMLGALDALIGDPWGRAQGLFFGGVPAAPPGRGVVAYEIVCVQLLWVVGAVQPHQPPAADSRQAPCCKCPAHQHTTVRTVAAAMARSCTLLRTGPPGASGGSGRRRRPRQGSCGRGWRPRSHW